MWEWKNFLNFVNISIIEGDMPFLSSKKCFFDLYDLISKLAMRAVTQRQWRRQCGEKVDIQGVLF